jgi:hypothetical protein
MDLTPRQARVVATAPQTAQKTLERAFQGLASPRQAIKAACLACTHFDRKEVGACPTEACPLWRYRPFQGKEAA